MSIEARTQTRRFRVTVITIGAVATLAAVWGIANASADQGKSSVADHAATASQLRQLEQNQLQALVDADGDALDLLLADDFVLVPPPGTPLTKDDYLGAVESGDLDFEKFEPISAIEVSVYGAAAVLTYKSDIVATAVGIGTVQHQAWHTVVYEKTSGTWQVVRAQTTAVGGFPPSNP
jgi:ketosteroid isomerase-like protein